MSPKRKKKFVKKRQGRLWQNNLSARNNQDIQRSYEEATMKKIVSVLCRRVSANVDKTKKSSALMTRHVTPPGKFDFYIKISLNNFVLIFRWNLDAFRNRMA